jgi:DNA-directed RNA polymerase specialized sigma24 family protein
VHLSDSLSNPGTPLLRLVAVLDELGGVENLQVSGDTREAVVAQTGAEDVASVRLQVKENRKLSPTEVVELVAAYEAGVSQRELTRRFGLHEQTVRAHLRRQEVNLRSVRVLTQPRRLR